MHRLAITLLLTAILLGTGACSSNKQGPHSTGPRRLEFKNAAKRGAAEDAAPVEMPGILPETHYAAGRLFESQGQLDKAIDQYRRAAALNHNFAAAYHRLGVVLSNAGRHEEAVEATLKGVRIRPDSAVLRNNLAYEYMHLKQWDHAERELRKAIELDPALTRAHVNLGLVLGRMQRFDESLAAFQAVLPEPDAHYNLGLLYRGQGQYAQAANAFRKVLDIAPQFPAAAKQLEDVEALLEAQVAEQRMRLVEQVEVEAPEPINIQDGTGSIEIEIGAEDLKGIAEDSIPVKTGELPDAAESDGASASNHGALDDTQDALTIRRLLEIIDNEVNCSRDPNLSVALQDVEIGSAQGIADEPIAAVQPEGPEEQFEGALDEPLVVNSIPGIVAEDAFAESDVLENDTLDVAPTDVAATGADSIDKDAIDTDASPGDSTFVGPPDDQPRAIEPANRSESGPIGDACDFSESALRQMASFQLIGNICEEAIAELVSEVATGSETEPAPRTEIRLASYESRIDPWFADFRGLDELVSITANEDVCLQAVEFEHWTGQATDPDQVGMTEPAGEQLFTSPVPEDESVLAQMPGEGSTP